MTRDEAEAAHWQDRRVLVTGASGLLGGALLHRLHALGCDTVSLVRDWVPHSELVQGGLLEQTTVVRGDVRDQELLERVLGEYEVDTVFHLAAQTIVPIANRNPAATFDANVRGTWALLEAARRSPTVRAIMVASSDKAYGESPELPYTEDMPLGAIHPYDVSKAAGDMIAQSYAATFGLPLVITRCGNLYGGGDLNWNRIVPGTVRSVLRGHAPVIRSDGSLKRDYFYIEDAAIAYTVAAEAVAARSDLRGEAFNFSSDEPLSVLDIVGRILKHMGSDLKPEVKAEANNEIQDQYLDASKAREVLDWKPRYSFDEGLGRTIAWYQDFLSN